MRRLKTAPGTVLVYPICSARRNATVVPNPQPTSLPPNQRHPPPNHRHPRATIVIPAQPSSSPRTRGPRRADKRRGAAYRASFRRKPAPKRTQRASSKAVPTTRAHQDRYRVPTSSYAIRVPRTTRSTRESQTTPFPVPFVKRAGSVEAAGFIPAQIGTILAEGARTHQTTNTPHSQSFQSRQSEFGQINVLKPVFCHTRAKANNNSGAHHAIRSDI